MRTRIKKRHAMGEFGTVYGTTRNVRANRLETRLDPLVPFPHRHAFYHLVVITAGSGWHEIDFRRHKVSPGKLFLMRPGQVHSWQLGKDTRGFVIEFEDSSLVPGVVAKVPEHAALPKPMRARTEALLRMMVDEYEGQETDFELSVRYLLNALLVQLSRLSAESPRAQTNDDPSLDRFLRLIEENYSKQHEVEFYAQALGTSAKALTMRATRTLEKSARALIQERLLLEAKRLLAYSTLSVAEAGYELGFEDPNYFTRFFRKHVGQAPGSFRDRVKGLTPKKSS